MTEDNPPPFFCDWNHRCSASLPAWRGLRADSQEGQLPAETIGHDYDLEYGTDRIEMHVDAVSKGDGVLLVDDLIATGGTAEAACKLIESIWVVRLSSAVLLSTSLILEGVSGWKKMAKRFFHCANLKVTNQPDWKNCAHCWLRQKYET